MGAQSQSAYQERYAALVAKYEEAKTRLETMEAEKKNCLVRRQKLENHLDNLRAHDSLMQSFDEHIFRSLVDCMTVYSKRIVAVKFHDGREIRVNPQK